MEAQFIILVIGALQKAAKGILSLDNRLSLRRRHGLTFAVLRISLLCAFRRIITTWTFRKYFISAKRIL